MKVSELIATIEITGGSVTLSPDGEHVRCRLPSPAGFLLKEVRLQRQEVLDLLKNLQRRLPSYTKQQEEQAGTYTGELNRQLFTGSVGRWLHECCVVSWRCTSNPRILHREYSKWARTLVHSYGEFITALSERGWRLDEDKMVVGVCLAEDFLVAVDSERTCRREMLN